MKATRTPADDCIPFEGRPVKYQSEALDRYWVETGRHPSSWAWVEATCGTTCLNVEHINLREPVRLGYQSGVCIYCGRSAHTDDHLLPRSWSGPTARQFVVVVPACGTCNNLLNDTLTWSITERRKIAHYRLRRKFRSVLLSVEFGDLDDEGFEGALKQSVAEGLDRKRTVDAMLAWPSHDPAYDLRACQKAGIADPHALGLIIPDEEAGRIAREVVGLAHEDGETRPLAEFGFRSHGTFSTYRLGCRCTPCVRAFRSYKRKSRPAPKLYLG